MSQFESFVNAELPKRIGTNADPTSVPAGKVPVTTGVGLLTEFEDYGAPPEYKNYVAAFAVRAHHVVVGQVDGKARELDVDNASHGFSILGIARQSADASVTFSVQSSGYMTEAGWSWNTGDPIFAGTDGALTQTVPSGAFCVVVAMALSATEITVSLQTPIYF
jgi:hypothetical protein